jgi:hypothetical protein
MAETLRMAETEASVGEAEEVQVEAIKILKETTLLTVAQVASVAYLFTGSPVNY